MRPGHPHLSDDQVDAAQVDGPMLVTWQMRAGRRAS
jgi:hypothetical protein